MKKNEIKELIEKAFDAGFDAGLYRGFESAGKEQSRKIAKPKVMTFKKFIELSKSIA